MTCTWQEEQAYRFAEGSLDDEARRGFEAHLADCAVCRERTAEAERLEMLLDNAITPRVAPPTLAARVAQAVAAERAPRRFGWPFVFNRRALSLALTSLLLAVGLLVVAAGPESVMAVVQRALFFVPGFGISAVDEDTLVDAAPVSVKQGNTTFTVTALLSDGKRTVVKFEVNGLPGGKSGWDKPVQVGSQAPEPPAVSKRAPVLRDDAGKEYASFGVAHTTGGSAQENHASGEIYFPALPKDTVSVTLVMPVDHIVPEEVLPGAASQEWRVSIQLVHPAQTGLPQATPQTAAASVNGVTLRVVAVAVEAERTVVLVEGEAPGKAWVMGLGANGDDILQATVLHDS